MRRVQCAAQDSSGLVISARSGTPLHARISAVAKGSSTPASQPRLSACSVPLRATTRAGTSFRIQMPNVSLSCS